MNIISRRNLLIAGVFLSLAPTFGQAATGFDNHLKKAALGGYDAVAYFTEKAAKPGDPSHKFQWSGVDWYFASDENMKLFAASPEKYAPQYGGHCAFAAAKGAIATGDPQAWTVVKDKLYINYSPAVREEWKQDIPGFIVQADKNWPNLSK
jgi:YHS domain-containing protein